MIRATKLFSHHVRRLHSARPLLASVSAQPLATASAASATGISYDQNRWSIGAAIGAAGLTALGLGLATVATAKDENSVAKCENPVEADEEEEEDKTTLFRTIPLSELDMNEDAGKSERAFTSALENSLFKTYNDGADDCEEADEDADEDGNDSNNTPPVTTENDGNVPTNGLLATSDATTTADDGINKEVILNRINTVRRNLGHNQVYTKKMYFYQSAKVKDYMSKKFTLFALPSSENLGKEMAFLLGTSLNCIQVGAFTDGETSVKIDDMVRGKEVFVVCTTTSTNSIMELLLTVSALRRGSAKRICAVIPYYGYSRQDRRTGMKREPIAAADIAKLLEEMGVDSVICVDLHNPLLKGFFSPTVPVDHLMPGPVAAAYFYEELYGTGDGDDAKEKKEPKVAPKITIVAAHENQVFRANGFRNALQKLSGNDDIRVALVSDTNALNVHEGSNSTTLVGDVEGRKCIIVDDIINTGGTLRSAIEMVDKSGASEVYAWATHGVLHLPQNDAPEKIQAMDCLKYLLISNSVAIDRELPSKIRKLSIAPLLAESVARKAANGSIKEMMKYDDGEKARMKTANSEK